MFKSLDTGHKILLLTLNVFHMGLTVKTNSSGTYTVSIKSLSLN